MENYKFVQEEINSSKGAQGTLLIPRKIYDTLIPTQEKALLPRELAAVYVGPGMIPGQSIDINSVTADTFSIKTVGEGAEIPVDESEYATSNIVPLKYGVVVKITSEMMEDSQFNLLQVNLAEAGKKFAEKETELILSALQGCTNNVSGGAAITISDITRAVQYLHDYDYSPSDLLIGFEVLNDLQNIDTFVEADKMGNRDMLANGWVGRIYGMNVWKFSTTSAPSTTYSKYAYVIDRSKSYVIVEKRPLSVKSFNMETRDMEGVALTQRIAVARLRDYATARISTS